MHSESDIAISVRHLTKTYRLFRHPGDRVKQFLNLGLRHYYQKFTALNDVSFEIKKGESIGIIGSNGSGKSTLLQLICGILTPTVGLVHVNGRISALLELGAGFDPEMTGRENIYFFGSVSGFSKSEIDVRFSAIADFADIGQFIDQQVRMYSSGMFVRLAFAVASHTDPDILIVDEALAVGDVAFQHKCREHLYKIKTNGCTVIYVSHDMREIANSCTRVFLLQSGSLIMEGLPSEVIKLYLNNN